MATYSLFNGSTAVAVITRADGPYNLGSEFSVTSAVWVTAIRYRRPDTTAQPDPTGGIYQVTNVNGSTGVLLPGTQVTIPVGATAGWKDAAPTTATKLVPGVRYRVVTRPTRFCQTTDYWNTGIGSGGITSGPLTAPNRAGAYGTAQSSFENPGTGLAYTGVDGGGHNWWSDVLVSDIDPTGRTQTQFLPFIR